MYLPTFSKEYPCFHLHLISQESLKFAPEPIPELSIVEVSENDIGIIEEPIDQISDSIIEPVFEPIIEPVFETIMEPPIKPFAQPTPTLEARQQSLEIAPFELPLVEVYKNNIDVIEPRGLPIEFTPPIHAYS